MDFTYSLLQDAATQIRLLRLLSRSEGDLLAFALETHDLSIPARRTETHVSITNPSYIAISYVWGSAERSHSIMIDGKQLKVGANCQYALWQACQHQPLAPEAPYFWIDQVSINQRDVIEKGKQVGMMDDIFRNASAVYASVGQDTPDSHFLCSVINRIDSQIFRDSDTPSQFDLVDRAISEAASRERTPGTLSESLDTFSSRAYFSRLWVTQELWLSANTLILCGSDSMSFDTLGRVWVLTFKDDSSIPEYSGGLVDVDSVYPHVPLVVMSMYHLGALAKTLSLNSAIAMTEHLGRFDPRDTVYAVRSLVVWPEIPGPLLPDYSITALELFWRAVPYLQGNRGDYDSDDDCTFFRRALSMSLENAELAASRLDYIKRLRKNLGLNTELKTLEIIKKLYPAPKSNLIDQYAHLLQQKDRGWYGQD